MFKLLALLGAAMLPPVLAYDTVVSGNMIYVGRTDPIVQPGAASQHVHNVFGASNFREYLNQPSEQLKAPCTSMKSTADKSNYWVPAMYWINYEPDGSRSYSLMPISVRAYYHHYTTPDTKVKTEAFPEGFRQVVGNAMNRSDDSHVSWRLERETGTRGSNEMGEWRPYFPSSNCSLTDPAPNCQDSSDCGSGAKDSKDHKSHVSFTIDSQTHEVGPGNGMQIECPPTHPHLYPRISLDILYYIKNGSDDDPYTRRWRKDRQNVVLANGDVTGRTYHADFYMGWDREVLQKTLDECWKGAEDDWAATCPPLAATLKPNKDMCLYSGQVLDEDIGAFHPIKQLPGGVKFWDWHEGDIMPTPDPVPAPKWVSPNAAYIGGVGQPLPLFVPDFVNDTNYLVGMDGKVQQLQRWGAPSVSPANTSIMVTSLEETAAGNVPHNDHNNVFGLTDTSEYTEQGQTDGAPSNNTSAT